jgi:hypothetical protein
MHKFFRILWIPMLIAAGFAPAQTAAPKPAATPAQAAAPAVSMKEFKGPDGHFAVMMPGTPAYETQDVPLQGGVKAQMNEWYVETDNHNISYMLMYNDYPPAYANGAPADMLIKFRDGATADKTLLTDQVITLGGIPGRAFTTKDKDGWLYDVHHFFLNKRLYQLIIVTAPGYTATYRDAFMDSFKIQ